MALDTDKDLGLGLGFELDEENNVLPIKPYFVSKNPPYDTGLDTLDTIDDDFTLGGTGKTHTTTDKIPIEKNIPKTNVDSKDDPHLLATADICNGILKLHDIKIMSLYFKGEITPNQLVKNVSIVTIYTLINRVLNYKAKSPRYYIQLPYDMFFYVRGEYRAILAYKLDESFEDLEMINLIGPSDSKNYEWSIQVKDLIEIDGDFSQIPGGTRLLMCDYLRILEKYPNIIEHIINLLKTDYQFKYNYADKSDDEMQKEASEHLQRQLERYPKSYEKVLEREIDFEKATFLPQETIDSIAFVQPVEYVTIEEIIDETFGTFEELSKRIGVGEPKQDKEPAKQLTILPANTTNQY